MNIQDLSQTLRMKTHSVQVPRERERRRLAAVRESVLVAWTCPLCAAAGYSLSLGAARPLQL